MMYDIYIKFNKCIKETRKALIGICDEVMQDSGSRTYYFCKELIVAMATKRNEVYVRIDACDLELLLNKFHGYYRIAVRNKMMAYLHGGKSEYYEDLAKMLEKIYASLLHATMFLEEKEVCDNINLGNILFRCVKGLKDFGHKVCGIFCVNEKEEYYEL